MSFYEIGKILKPHGLNGVFKVKAYTDFLEERFSEGSIIYIGKDDTRIMCEITSYRLTKGDVYISCKGYEDINLIEDWRQKTIYVHEDDLHELNDNEYYVRDLIGIGVYLNSDKIGEIADIYSNTSDDILVVKRPKQKNALIPLRDEFVKSVNLKTRSIHIYDVEGLL
jgi:16S rRNA processing protein RimM